ncbi:MAG: T9SS type A sorting domain-containing protein [Saprospiraceae bacterium]
MKTFIIALIFSMVTSNLYCQNNFEWIHTIPSETYSKYLIGLDLPNDTYFFSSINRGVNTFDLIAPDGSLIKSIQYSLPGKEVNMVKGFWLEDKQILLVMGAAAPNLFVTLILDEDMNILHEYQQILPGDAKQPYQIDVLIDTASNQLLMAAPSMDGFFDESERTVMWFLKMNLDTYTIDPQLVKLNEKAGYGQCYSILKNIDDGGYTCYGKWIHRLDYNFIHQSYAFEPEHKITSGNQVKAIHWKDSTYMVGSTGSSRGGVDIQVFDKNLKRKFNFGLDYELAVAFPHNVFDINAKGLLYTGVFDTPFYHQSKGFFIAQFSAGFKKNWELYIGALDQYRYTITGLLATKDGGVLVYGARYDDLGHRVFNAYIIKFNEQGKVTWTNNIASESFIKISTYPNPSSGPLTIDVSGLSDKADIRIFDMLGRNVFVQNGIIDGITEMNLSGLSEGTYVYKMYQGNKEIYSGRWVKTGN